jgi:hypothetical protein
VETEQRSSPIADSFATRLRWLGARTPREHVTIGIILLIFGVVAFGISPWLAWFTVTSGLLLLTWHTRMQGTWRGLFPNARVPFESLPRETQIYLVDLGYPCAESANFRKNVREILDGVGRQRQHRRKTRTRGSSGTVMQPTTNRPAIPRTRPA